MPACRFALVGGPARQDAPKAVDALKKLNVPYMVSLPLVFQTTEEWMASELGVHPVQVALQVTCAQHGLCVSHLARHVIQSRSAHKYIMSMHVRWYTAVPTSVATVYGSRFKALVLANLLSMALAIIASMLSWCLFLLR